PPTLRHMSPLDALGLAPMSADMERVETALQGSVLSSDPFLSDVAGHLISAGGKRLRPALALFSAYAAKGVGPVSDDAITLADTYCAMDRVLVHDSQPRSDADRSVDAYTSAIEGKTASLFGTACRVGGMVSAVDDATLDALTTFGHHLGMCFQIVDDVLDVTRTEAELGKPVGNDLLEGVYTLPVIYAIEASSDLAALLGRTLDPERLEQARALVADVDS